MEKEFLSTLSTTITLNIAGNEINSVRKIVNSTSTVRVYKDGIIGVAGCVGEADFEKLEREAVERLDDGIEYPCHLPEESKHTVVKEKKIDSSKLLNAGRSIMKRINDHSGKRFLLSGGIYYSEIEKKYSNSNGVEYNFSGNSIQFDVVLKDRQKANLFDAAYSYYFDEWDEDKIFNDFVSFTEKYDTPADIENGVYPVVSLSAFLYPMGEHLLGGLYAVGASLFSNKLGEKVFADKFSLFSDLRDEVSGQCFFDAEGQMGVDGKDYIFKNGVLEKLIGTKKDAAKYNLPICAGSAADYDGIPSYGFQVGIESTCTRIEEVIGDKAVLVVIASGGDMTTEGDYATPAQNSYLLEKGKIVGRLPDIAIYSNVFKMLNEDFLGASNKGICQCGHQNWVAINMNVVKQ